ncbi:MAG TPA: hypothetical protein VEN82_00595, partial [Actinomycetota bacterium]|nr:hypothetical protein [Actinomycetota bacterium]
VILRLDDGQLLVAEVRNEEMPDARAGDRLHLDLRRARVFPADGSSPTSDGQDLLVTGAGEAAPAAKAE